MKISHHRGTKTAVGISTPSFQRDYSLIMAMTVIYAFAVASLNVVVDVLYGYIDPRIRYS